MEVKTVVAMVVEVALVVIIGFLIIEMIQIMLTKDSGIIYNFFKDTLDAICSTAKDAIGTQLAL